MPCYHPIYAVRIGTKENGKADLKMLGYTPDDRETYVEWHNHKYPRSALVPLPCGLFGALDVEEFVVVPRRTELFAAFRRRNVDILVFNTVRIFVEILTCNSRLSGHECKLRLNIVVCIELSFLSFEFFHYITGGICAGLPSNLTYYNITVRPTLL